MTDEKTLPHDVHDRGYRLLLSFWKIFRQLMEGYVQEEWKDRLDFEKSEKVEGTFILPGFEKKETDVLYKVPFLGEEKKEIYLYVLIEHQSSVDYMLAFRVLVYLVEIWKHFYKNSDENQRSQKGFRLPPVFPIVLYNGAPTWTAATSVRELVEQGETFADFIPSVKYHLIDIPRIDKEELKQLGNTLAGVFLLEHDFRGEDFTAALKDALDMVEKETDRELYSAVVQWILMLLKREFPEQAADLGKNVDPNHHNREEVRTMLETMPAKLMALGKEKGIREGIKEGIREGIKDSILTVLEAKFGEVAEGIRPQLGSIKDPESGKILLKKATNAQTLGEFQKILDQLPK